MKGTKRKIVEHLSKNPKLTNKELSEIMNISPQMTSIHIKGLISDNLVQEEILGREKKFDLTDSGSLIVSIFEG